jgi:hypothetical protein
MTNILRCPGLHELSVRREIHLEGVQLSGIRSDRSRQIPITLVFDFAGPIPRTGDSGSFSADDLRPGDGSLLPTLKGHTMKNRKALMGQLLLHQSPHWPGSANALTGNAKANTRTD